MEIRTDIKKIISQYANASVSIEDPERENFLRFQRNVEYVFGLKVGTHEYNKLHGVLTLNHICEQKSMMEKSFHVSDYAYSQSPCIYITLHLGCYEEIAAFLIRKEGKVCIPVTERVYLQETRHYNENLAKRGMACSQLVFVNIESSTGLRQMIRYAHEGYSLLCYIDGNSGIGGMTRNDSKLEKIRFFNTTIHVRKGIEYVSRILNRDIIPIYSYIEDISFQPHIVLMPPFERILHHTITDSLWYMFGRVIWQYYWQWEAWLYVDEFIDHSTDMISKQSGYTLNADRYLPLIKSGVCYFYDRQTNRLVKVGRRLFGLLGTLEDSPVSTRVELSEYIPHETLVEDLLSKKIIVKI